ncbi:MAG: PD-(D/E)XK nuclease family protein [Undibacterium sp.]|nr:PD-(D/E)XK nuclease family protein [Opitutaceae bacterium]
MHAKIPELLKRVETLRKEEAVTPKDARNHRFNIFRILKMGSLEAATHTPYIAEFLNPQGAHGLGIGPLQAFIERFKLAGLTSTTITVRQEYDLGPKTPLSGGRVDIVLFDKRVEKHTAKVAIENKIGAADQLNQLGRYRRDLPNAKLIYLTRLGDEPSDYSTVKKDDVLCLSYKHDIIRWQADCREMKECAPVVSETITQYINALKHLTGQSTNEHMSNQIVQAVLKDPYSFAAYRELIFSQTAVFSEVESKLREQCATVANRLKLQTKFQRTLGENQPTFLFFDQKMRDSHLSIAFQFHNTDCRKLSCGIVYDDKSSPRVSPEISGIFKSKFPDGAESDWWITLSEWRYRDLPSDSDEILSDIVFGRFQNELTEKVESLSKIVQSALQP